MSDQYLDAAKDFYDQLALGSDQGACCVQSFPLDLPGLYVPDVMTQMAYSCGCTVHPEELTGNPTVLYVGVGGGLEALMFAYFARKAGGVIAIEPSANMRRVAMSNLESAKSNNDWFDTDFVQILDGDAFHLQVPDSSVDVVAQNCLFNIFEPDDLDKALREVARVLRPGGRLMMSDPIAARPIPDHLKTDQRLRAMCLSGALVLDEYIAALNNAGFDRTEVRVRKPYRVLDVATYDLDEPLALDAFDTVSFKGPVERARAGLYTGRRAIYIGPLEHISLNGIALLRHQPTLVSDQLADQLKVEHTAEVLISAPNWRYEPHTLTT